MSGDSLNLRAHERYKSSLKNAEKLEILHLSMDE
jgi:hypothetical protein